MKLYARLSNEKGKVDGMGANEYLKIDITVGSMKLETLTVRKCKPNKEKSEMWGVFDEDGNLIREIQA